MVLVNRFTAFFAAPHILLQERGWGWLTREYIIKWVWLNTMCYYYTVQDGIISWYTDISSIVFSTLVHVSSPVTIEMSIVHVLPYSKVTTLMRILIPSYTVLRSHLIT